MVEVAASFRDVHKSLRGKHVLRGLTFEVYTGEIVALLGPNGAGKTTAVNVLLGLRSPDTGSVSLLGGDPRKRRVRKRVGATPQEISLPPTLTVKEIVDFVVAHYPKGVTPNQLLYEHGLENLGRRQAGGLSGGEKRRLAIALAFAGRPEIMVLDEPSTGLDISVRRQVWDKVKAFADSGGTVLLTTHYLEEAEALATSVLLIDQGKLIISGTPEQVKEPVEIKRVMFRTLSTFDARTLPSVASMSNSEEQMVLYTHNSDAVIRELVKQNIQFENLSVASISLEEAIRGLTEGNE